MKIQKKNKEFVWVKCGQIDGHEPETEFIDFHEDLYKFTRKSVYCIIMLWKRFSVYPKNFSRQQKKRKYWNIWADWHNQKENNKYSFYYEKGLWNDEYIVWKF